MSQTRADTLPNPDTALAARSMLYALFAKALSHPDKDILADFVSGQFDADVKGLMQEAGYSAAPGKVTTGTGAAHDMDIAYATAFEAGLPKVSLREANYVREGEKVLFEDLFRFYDHFGLDTSSGTLREWPDHIAVELEFMHYLTWLEAEQGTKGAPLRLAQRDFLAHHPGHWAGPLADRLAEKIAPAPWPDVARLLADFIAAETDMLEG